jgi:glycosyltransferase involved in cell wall biosynthesis
MDLSILIPSRNEEFLKQTIEDILANIEADTEVIAVLDGQWPIGPILQYERVKIIYVPKAIGQRAAQNLAARLSEAKYVMKVDAHCSFDKGFDRKMIEGFKKMGDDCTIVPIMRNLWAFDWVCPKCGARKYQDKGGICDKCGTQMTKEMKWIGKENPQSVSYTFDKEPHFQYFNEYRKRPEYKKQIKTGFTETMSLQGSCFMSTRDNYWKWELCDESLGNWGNQGIEIALSTWLTGHKVLVNHNTWYAHMFRTKAVNDFGFPWPVSGKDVMQTKNKVKDKFWNMKHKGQKYPVSWLLKKFWPLPGWDEKDLK